MPRSHAKKLRKNMTDAERKLWHKLRNRQLEGLYFRRQCPMGKYIVDFACHEARLIIEVDGGQHNSRQGLSNDRSRDDWFQSQGYDVLRFWNPDVLANTEGVLTSILEKLNESVSPSPNPSHQGRGILPDKR